MIEQITQIMNDPDQMKQIMEIAASLGLGEPSSAPTEHSAEFPAELTKFLTQAQKKDEKQQALVRALLPYLRPAHQKRLENAIRVAKLSHIAGAALRTESQTSSKEVTYDV